MTGETDSAHEPARHYDTVIGAWGYLLQEDLHYGYFETGEEALVTATNSLTSQMLSLARLSAGQQFSESCDVLRNFWNSKVLGYGIISAQKPA